MNVEEYLKEDGSSPYQEWFDSLDAQAAAKVTVAKSRLELGNISNVKWFDGIGEYKIDWGPGYRIYLAQDGKQLIVLFGGGTRKISNLILMMLKDCTKSTKDEKKKLAKSKKLKTRIERRGSYYGNY